MGLLTFIRSNNNTPIDTKKWKEFPIVDLFDVVLSSGDNQAKLLEDGDIPLVSSGKNLGNGICKYIKQGDGKSEIFNSNTITVDMFGKAYYQERDYFAVSHGRVNILLPKFNLNKNIGLFIVAVLDKRLEDVFPYGEMCNQSQLKKQKIPLPICDNNSPDWVFMNKYMSKVYSQVKELVL